jgi:hypothetical protein
MGSNRAPVNDAIIAAVARLVDDAQSGRREPSHSDIEFQINRAGLELADPTRQGQTVGKAKRVRAVLSWAIENAPDKAETFVAALVAQARISSQAPGSSSLPKDHQAFWAATPPNPTVQILPARIMTWVAR